MHSYMKKGVLAHATDVTEMGDLAHAGKYRCVAWRSPCMHCVIDGSVRDRRAACCTEVVRSIYMFEV